MTADEPTSPPRTGSGEVAWHRPLHALARLVAPDAGPPERFIASGLCAVAALVALLLDRMELPTATWTLVGLSYLAGGLRTFLAGVVSIRQGKPDINLLMIVAAIVSAILGHWDDGALLLFLFSLSDALERFAIERTRRGVTALLNLRPATATRVRADGETVVAVAELQAGDEIRVRPGERFPVDGVVITGTSAADESIVTGESLPVEKRPGDSILAGTINANGSLLVRMTRGAAESTIARIVHLVEHAQESKPVAQRLIERWQTPYVVGVFAVALLAFLLSWARGSPVLHAVQTAMILLVAASPCAVVLASPVAVLAAVTRGARSGVLFKGGAVLERLGTIDTVAFDKTGTLTRGRPVLTHIVPTDGTSEDEVLRVAASIEHHSEHPLSRAIMAEVRNRGLSFDDVDHFANEPGLGIVGRVNGRWIGAGRIELFDRHGIPLPSALRADAAEEHEGTTVVVFRQDGIGGVFHLRDTVRAEAAATLAGLRALGIRRMVMLTGDRPPAARAVADRLGISDVRAGIHPAQKMAEIRQLSKQTAGVAMVGDGVNDAPALAAADIGIAMGGAGTDVAMETADVVLMRDDLRGLCEAVHLAQRCRTVIQRCLLFAFGMIVVLVLLTMLGWLSLPMAVIGHEGTTVLVVLAGLRLLREPPAAPNRSPAPTVQRSLTGPLPLRG